MSDWKPSLQTSLYDLERVVWPAISPLVGGGKFSPWEGAFENEMQRTLDIFGGVDWIQHLDNGTIQTWATRVQWGQDWSTFTIRESREYGTRTELAKRIQQVETEGCLYPTYTLQAYISEKRVGQLLSVAFVKTKELISYIQQAPNEVYRRAVFDNGAATFLVIKWNRYQKFGFFIQILRPGEKVMTIHPIIPKVQEVKPMLEVPIVYKPTQTSLWET